MGAFVAPAPPEGRPQVPQQAAITQQSDGVLHDPTTEAKNVVYLSSVVSGVLEAITAALLGSVGWLGVTVFFVTWGLWWLICFVLLAMWGYYRSPDSRKHRALKAEIELAKGVMRESTRSSR